VVIKHRNCRKSFRWMPDHVTASSTSEKPKGVTGGAARGAAAMERNAAHVTDFFNLPGEQVVEIGRQISV
jgi:K+ transporter